MNGYKSQEGASDVYAKDPSGRTYYEPVKPTLEEQNSSVKQWEVPAGGSIASSAVISKGVVYFGACDQHIYALDAKDGSLVWKYRTNDAVASSPCVVDNVLYCGSEDGYLYALSVKDGTLLWRFKTAGSIFSSPCVVNGRIYFGSSDGNLYTLDLDGKLIWRFYTGDNRITCSPGVVNDAVFFCSYDGKYYAISTEGRPIWNFRMKNVSGCSPTICDGDFNPVWTFTMCRNKDPEDIRVKNGLLYFGSWDNHVYCLNIDDGCMVWMYVTGGITSSVGGAGVYKRNLYCGSWDHNLYSFSAEDGRLNWKVQTNGAILGMGVVHDGVIYLGNETNYLRAYSTSGEELWKFATGGPIVAVPWIENNTLYVGCWDTYFYAIDINKRSLLWKFRTSLKYESPIDTMTKAIKEATEKRFTISQQKTTPNKSMYKPAVIEAKEGFHEYGSGSNPYRFTTHYGVGGDYGDRKRRSQM